MKRRLLFMLFLLLISGTILGQGNLKISGKVTDNNGEALIGANVIIKSLKLGAATDLEGNYAFEVPASLINGQTVELSASLVSHKTKTVKITLSGTNITQNFSLDQDAFRSDEVVVTGIASKTSKSIAEIAVTKVSADDLQTMNTYGGLQQLLQGKVSGVQVTTASGNVGAGWKFFVRGGGGINGNGQPVIYIDGTRLDNSEASGYGVGGQAQSTLANLNTNDIENVEFLKGPAAASMYGANASNGIVLITTKSGKTAVGGPGIAISYRFNYGWNEKIYTYKSDEFVNAASTNSWLKKGPVRENFVSAAGGSSLLKYYVSFENRGEQGIIPNTNGDRNSVRLNLTSVPSENVTLKLTAGYVRNRVRMPMGDNSGWGILYSTLNFNQFSFIDSTAIISYKNEGLTDQFVGNASLTYSPIKNLELKAGIGLDNSHMTQTLFQPYGIWYSDDLGTKGYYNRNMYQLTYDFNAAYNFDIMEDLKLRSIAGGQFFDRKYRRNRLTASEFTTNLITNINAASSRDETWEGFDANKEGGLYTEHSLSYQDQYFLTLGIRQDFANVIGESAPSIVYPKASFALRLDKYDFIPINIFQLLKFRTAYGESGQLPGNTAGVGLLWDASTSAYGAGARPSVTGNPEIQPERVKEIELGLDIELLNDISLELTYYIQNTINSIINKPIAPSYGLPTTKPFNVGKVEASGFESLIQYSPLRSADYSLQIGLIWNYQTNKVTDMGGAAPITSFYNSIQKDMAKSEFWTYKTVGANFDATGKYTSPIRSTDRVDLGNPYPKHTGSFTIDFKFLKDFRLYAFGEWGLKLQRYNFTKSYLNSTGSCVEYNRLRALLGLSELATGAAPKDVTPLTVGSDEYKATAEKYAKLSTSYAGNYIEDADYFVFRELSLSYELDDILKEFDVTRYIKALSVGVSVRNVFRTTKYSGFDFETNESGSRTIESGTEFFTLQNPRTINFWFRLGI